MLVMLRRGEPGGEWVDASAFDRFDFLLESPGLYTFKIALLSPVLYK